MIVTLIGCEGPWADSYTPPLDDPPVALGAAAVMVDGALHNAASGLGRTRTVASAMADEAVAALPVPVEVEVAEWRGLFAVLERPLPNMVGHPMQWAPQAVARGECGDGVARHRWALYDQYLKAQSAYFRTRERHFRAQIASLQRIASTPD